jgi:hypothetical protein
MSTREEFAEHPSPRWPVEERLEERTERRNCDGAREEQRGAAASHCDKGRNYERDDRDRAGRSAGVAEDAQVLKRRRPPARDPKHTQHDSINAKGRAFAHLDREGDEDHERYERNYKKSAGKRRRRPSPRHSAKRAHI